MKNLLVTGGAGFIGSNFVKFLLGKYPQYRVINIDLLTYAGNLENLKDVENSSRHVFIKADIRDRCRIDKIFSEFGIDSVVNFAAESHVDRSIEEPEIFLTTNVIGTQVLLDNAKKHWKINPEDKYCDKYIPGVRFLQVSTDEVYGTLGRKGKFTENTPLAPNSPYSASKAGADMVVRAYGETYGLPVNITRCSNNYGPYQFPEKLIPLMICNCLQERVLPVYGDGMHVRDWIHVSDHCRALDVVLHEGKPGEVYNIGGNNEKTNLEITRLILEKLKKPESLIKYVKDRPGHDRRYSIDNTKISSSLGWKPSYTFEEGIEDAVQWYVKNMDWIKGILSGDYQSYYSRMYSRI